MRVFTTLLWSDYRSVRREIVHLLALMFALLLMLAAGTSGQLSDGRFHLLLGGFGTASVLGVFVGGALLYRDARGARCGFRMRLPCSEQRVALARTSSVLGLTAFGGLLGFLAAAGLLLAWGYSPWSGAYLANDFAAYTCLLLSYVAWTIALSRYERSARAGAVWVLALHGAVAGIAATHAGLGLAGMSHYRTSYLLWLTDALPGFAAIAGLVWLASFFLPCRDRARRFSRRGVLRTASVAGLLLYGGVPIVREQLRHDVRPDAADFMIFEAVASPNGRHLILQGARSWSGRMATGAPILVDLDANEWRWWAPKPTQLEIWRSWAGTHRDSELARVQFSTLEVQRGDGRWELAPVLHVERPPFSPSLSYGEIPARESERTMHGGEWIDMASWAAVPARRPRSDPRLTRLGEAWQASGHTPLASAAEGVLVTTKQRDLLLWRLDGVCEEIDSDTRLSFDLDVQRPNWVWSPGLGLFDLRAGRVLEGSEDLRSEHESLRRIGDAWLISAKLPEGDRWIQPARHWFWRPGGERRALHELEGVGLQQILAFGGQLFFVRAGRLWRWDVVHGTEQEVELRWPAGEPPHGLLRLHRARRGGADDQNDLVKVICMTGPGERVFFTWIAPDALALALNGPWRGPRLIPGSAGEHQILRARERIYRITAGSTERELLFPKAGLREVRELALDRELQLQEAR